MTPAEYAYLSLFIGNFAARDDAYVLDSRQHIPEPLTPEALSHHWAGGHSVSGYTSFGALTQVGAIDLDAGTVEDAEAVQGTLLSAGIPALLCPSRRGAHLWTFHTAPDHGQAPAHVVRSALQMAVGLSGWPHPHFKAEVFPRRGTSDWSCGALRLPLMAHPKDGQVRPVFAPGSNEPITRIGPLLEAVAGMTSDFAQMYAFSDVANADRPYHVPDADWRKRRESDDDVPLVSVLLTYLGVERAIPGRATHCPFHGDTHSSLSIARDDERVFCKQPACDLYNDGRGFGSFQLANYIREHHHAAA